MRLVALITIVALLLFAGGAAAFSIRGHVIANGGLSAIPASNGSYKVYGTVGSPALQASQNASSHACSGFWCFGGSRVLAVDPDGASSLPREFALGPATPNPTGGRTRFDLALPRSAVVTLTVYDVAGRQVGDAISRKFEAGKHDLFWREESIPTGIYFVRLATDGVVRASRTLVVVR